MHVAGVSGVGTHPDVSSELARMGYTGMVTSHSFRTWFSTCANETAWNSDVIEKRLAHEERDEVRGAYNRAHWMTERAKLMQWWADRQCALREEAQVLSRELSE